MPLALYCPTLKEKPLLKKQEDTEMIMFRIINLAIKQLLLFTCSVVGIALDLCCPVRQALATYGY
jgi:hypothetical protein